jgi:Protein of unknown function (DUF3300)
MHPKRQGTAFQSLLVIICIIGILPGDTLAYMPPPQQAATPTSTAQTQSAKIPPDQLDSLVAPIALYPDPLLAQVLAASTYPLEIISFNSGWQITRISRIRPSPMRSQRSRGTPASRRWPLCLMLSTD